MAQTKVCAKSCARGIWDTSPESTLIGRWLFLSSANTNHAHLSVIGGVFLFESVIRYAALVRYSEFGVCSLFGSSKCIASTGIAVGTSTVVRYSDEVRNWGSVIGGSTVVAKVEVVKGQRRMRSFTVLLMLAREQKPVALHSEQDAERKGLVLTESNTYGL